MTTELRMPSLGFSTQELTLAEYLLEDGCSVNQGQAMYVVETDKSAQEIEAPVAGVFKILKPAGQKYSVGELIAVIS